MSSRRDLLFFLLIVSLAFPLAVRAQSSDPERHQSHVRIESSGNGSDAARAFQMRLEQLRKNDALKLSEADLKFLKNLLRSENLDDTDKRAEAIRRLGENPHVQQLAQKWLSDQKNSNRLKEHLTREEIKALSEAIKKEQNNGDKHASRARTDPSGGLGTESERQSNSSSNNQEGEERSNPAAGPPHSDPPSHDPDHLRAEADARQQLHRFGDFLDDAADRFRDSPAVSKALRDLSRQTLTQDTSGGESLQEQLARFNRYTQRADGWADSGRSFFGRLDLPGLPKIKAPRMDLPAPNLPSFNTPAMNVPDVGSESAWSAILWVAVAAAFGLVLWKLWSQLQTSGSGDSTAAWRLGPWPVNPARIATGEELIRAFEYLSLLRFGPVARTWNHLDVAAGLTEKQPELQQAAHDLAATYEQARYAPANDLLTDEAIYAARQNLCFLAGVTAL